MLVIGVERVTPMTLPRQRVSQSRVSSTERCLFISPFAVQQISLSGRFLPRLSSCCRSSMRRVSMGGYAQDDHMTTRRAMMVGAFAFPCVAMASSNNGGEKQKWWPPAAMRKAFALGMAEGMADYELAVCDRKRELLGKLAHSKRVLDVGIGTGPNLPYLRDVDVVVGLDPNEFMTPYAQKAAEQQRARGLQLEMKGGHAEKIPFPDSSFDAVISTLVLCSVVDPAQAISEIQRVLKPGGKFVFIEHVHAKSEPLRFVQTVLNPLQVLAADGCHLSRDTEKLIREHGAQFESVEIENFKVDSGAAGALISTQICGFAVKKQGL